MNKTIFHKDLSREVLVPKHSDYVAHISNEEDIDVLTRPLFDVNMRLFKTSPDYKAIIANVCRYIRWSCLTKKEGYVQPRGMSCANMAIPFNIIGVKRGHLCTIMINPKIIRYYGKVIQTNSNCGSLTLLQPIPVNRYEFIDMTYYDEVGKKWKETAIGRYDGGFTIQHEVDHNRGILITDPSDREPSES